MNFGPEDFRKRKASEPEKDPDGPKRIVDVLGFFEQYSVATYGKPKVEKKFTRYNVECSDCHRKDAYAFQYFDGGGLMSCYGGH